MDASRGRFVSVEEVYVGVGGAEEKHSQAFFSEHWSVSTCTWS